MFISQLIPKNCNGQNITLSARRQAREAQPPTLPPLRPNEPERPGE
jgi:hypothetical protein